MLHTQASQEASQEILAVLDSVVDDPMLSPSDRSVVLLTVIGHSQQKLMSPMASKPTYKEPS